MSINNKLSEIQQIDSLEIYDFITEVYTYRYTSYDKEVIIDNNTYLPVSIKRSGFRRDLNRGIIECTITAPISVLFNQFITLYPLLSIKVKIKKYFIDDFTEYIMVFNGIIKGITISGKERIASANCVSSMDELNTKVPYIFVQSFCNNSLYDSICKLNKNNFSQSVQIILDPADKTKITLLGVILTDDYYTLGTMEYEKEKRLIIEQKGSICKIQIPFIDLTDNSLVKIIRGCDKTKETCYNTFKNIDNFLGMPYVKSGQNPVDFGVT